MVILTLEGHSNWNTAFDAEKADICCECLPIYMVAIEQILDHESANLCDCDSGDCFRC